MQGIELMKDFLGCRQSRLKIITPGAIGTCPIRSTIKAILKLLTIFVHDRMVRRVSRQPFREEGGKKERNVIQAASSISDSNHGTESWSVCVFKCTFESILASQMPLSYPCKQTVHKWWPTINFSRFCANIKCMLLLCKLFISLCMCVCVSGHGWRGGCCSSGLLYDWSGQVSPCIMQRYAARVHVTAGARAMINTHKYGTTHRLFFF